MEDTTKLRHALVDLLHMIDHPPPVEQADAVITDAVLSAVASWPPTLAMMEQQAAELAKAKGQVCALEGAIIADVNEAKGVCGGDGDGCDVYRDYYETPEERHRKCGVCPMDAVFYSRAALESCDE